MAENKTDQPNIESKPMEQKITSGPFNSLKELAFLWDRRKPILYATVIAMIGSIIFSSSFFIRPKFKSSVILFPATNSSISRSLLSDVAFEKENILQFGEEEQVEQMMQILYSDEIRERVIKDFDLMKHYRINKNSKFPKTKLKKVFEDNITFNRTEYLSVRIDVLDEDPIIAANIANRIGDLLDSVKTRMQQERAFKALGIVEKEYFDFLHYLESREDTLKKLRNLGVLDYYSQVERLSEAYGKALLASSGGAVKTIQNKMDTLAKYGGLYISISQDMQHDRIALSRLRTKFEEARIDATQKLPHKFIVNRATPAEKKTYPVRWLIVLVSTLGTLLMAILTVFIIENVKRMGIISQHGISQ